jgi:filamentous hemagglutinin family protein
MVMQLNRHRLFSSAAIILCVGAPPLIGPLARADNVLPRGGTVATGSISIGAPAGNGLTVTQGSARGIINWNSFSVGQSNSVTFVQPNASSATLNRVTGSTTSTIAGQIRSNGQVYLVNPNGIAITATGSVKVGGGFVGSTLGITDQNFMDGKQSFSGDGASAGVTNAGHIQTRTKGFVALVGGTVDNSGTISVPLGKVGLGSGERATLDLTGDGFLQVAMPTRATAADGRGLVDVSGKVRAAGGSVELRAATVASAIRDAVNVSGVVTAKSVSGHDGSITLSGDEGGNVAVSGGLSVAGGKSAEGGTVVVTGHDVNLLPTAVVDASGTAGGTVLIGGDRQGGADASTKFVKQTVQTAATTRVAARARILANGRKGAGGNVVVWSDDATSFAGAIAATGGGRANGGFVETSAKGRLTVADGATVDTLAPRGQAGDWLLDPATITVDSTGGATLTQAGHTSDTTSNITISTATLDVATSNVILSARTSIAVDSTISLYNNHVGITFEGAGTAAQIAAGPTLGTTLSTDLATSNGAILIKGAVKLASDVTIDAGNAPITVTKGVSGPFFLTITGSGVTTITGPVSGLKGLTTAAAPTTIGGDISTTGAITFYGATTLGGNITTSSSAGTVTFYDVATLGGNISTRNAAVAFNNGVATKLSNNATISSGTGAVTFSGTVDGDHILTVDNSGGTTFVGTVGATTPLAGLTTGTGLTTFNGNVTTRNGAITIGGATAIGNTLTISAGTGSVSFAGAVDGVDQIGFDLTVSNSGATTFGGPVGVTDTFIGLTTGTGTTTLGGNVKAGGNIIFNGPVVLDANVDINIDNGFSTITFAKTVDGAFDLTTFAAAGTIFGGPIGATTALASLKSSVDSPIGAGPTTVHGSIAAAGGVTFGGDATVGGNITTTNGNVTVNGATTLRHDVAVTTGTGAIGFTGTVDGAYDLALNSSGNMLINGPAGRTTALTSLTTGMGQISLNGDVVTTGAQSYGGAVRLLGPLIMDAGAANITFAGTIRSAAAPVDFNSLTVMTNGLAIFDGTVNLGGELLRTGTGSTIIAADITTHFNQFYEGPVTLLGNRTLRTSNADISFLSTIDTAAGASAPARLTVITGNGAQDYEGALGATNALGGVVLRSSDGGGVSLANITNNIGSVNIATRGAVTVADSGPLTVTGIATTGDILVTTQTGNLTVTGAVATTSATATALVLQAGRTASRVTLPGAGDTGGNVVLDGGSLSVGAGGFGLIYTGSIAGSTGLSAAVAPGNFRYWSDTNGNTGYTTALTSGISAIYRERPAITVSATAGSGRVYNGTTTVPVLMASGQVNGDIGSATGTIAITGAGSSLRNAGRYVIGVTGVSEDATLSGLGYAVRAGRSTYVITPATLTYTADTATRVYGATDPALSGTVTGFVGGDSQANATAGTLIFTTPATASSKAGLYAIDGSGLTAKDGNYRFVQTPGNATALTITSLDFGASSNAFLPPDLIGTSSIMSGDAAAPALCSSASVGETLVKQGSVVIFSPGGGCGS